MWPHQLEACCKVRSGGVEKCGTWTLCFPSNKFVREQISETNAEDQFENNRDTYPLDRVDKGTNSGFQPLSANESLRYNEKVFAGG